MTEAWAYQITNKEHINKDSCKQTNIMPSANIRHKGTMRKRYLVIKEPFLETKLMASSAPGLSSSAFSHFLLLPAMYVSIHSPDEVSLVSASVLSLLQPFQALQLLSLGI
jgi:hypothetical protein